MPKEYRTIEEVAGPLMLVKGVSDVNYNDLGEIELASGEVRRCKVLEINGEDALVQLFDSAAGINLSNSKVRFLGKSMELGVSTDMLSRVFDGMGKPIDGGPDILPVKRMDINGLPMNRRSEHPRQRSKASDLLGVRSASCTACGSDRAPGACSRYRRAVCGRIRRHGYHL